MKWDDEIKFVDTAKLTKIHNLREIKKQYIEKLELELNLVYREFLRRLEQS